MEKTGNHNTNSYDQVPYLAISHSLTHPDNMATIGTLLGLNPANIGNCRVLELGCANGGNLMPMALSLPSSSFLGLDYSAVQIAQGQQAIEKLGLGNIKLKHLNIMDVDTSLGQFDYIIVHGIFSWVPEAVREKILSICDRNLAPEGIAYVSYNTFPGWYSKRIARDMMLYHTRKTREPGARIHLAREFINFMAASAASIEQLSRSPSSETYVRILKYENEWLGKNSDSYLYHEELEENNDPIYFYQFAEWAGQHGLQYLSEARMNEVFMNEIPKEIRQSLLGMSDDLIELEQYRDFLMNRLFRSTLLVHNDLKISHKINPDRISTLFVGSNCLPASSGANIYTEGVEQFVGSPGIKLATDHPVTRAAMRYLSEIWPDVVPIDKLLETAYDLLRKASPSAEFPLPENSEVRARDLQLLKANLLKGFVASTSLVELHVHAPMFASILSEYPVASPWARFQVMLEANKLKTSKDEKLGPLTVTNLRHESIELEGVTPFILYQLDGSCSRDELMFRLVESLEDGSLSILKLGENKNEEKATGNKPVSVEQAKKALAKNLDADLQWLAKAALLVA
jgi:methyltransferase-like protein/SAM-dependent methyltransferase